MNIIRISARICFEISSKSSVSRTQKGNSNPFKILSFLAFHTEARIHKNSKYWFLVEGIEDIENIDDAVTLFDQMLQLKPLPQISDFNKLFKVLVKMEHYSQVIVMFKKLSLLGFQVNEYTMSTVINCYCKLKKAEWGFAILGWFLKIGYAPNIFAITCMIKGFFLQENAQMAVELFTKVSRDDLCEVNEFTVSTVLDGLSKSGNIVNAVKWLEMLEKKNCELNVVVYTTVLDGLCKARMVEDAMHLLFKMIDRGIQPDVVTYTSFLYGLCNHKKIDFARSLFNDLPSKGIYPNVITYTVMIQGLCKLGLLQDVEEMVEEMERTGCPPNSVTCNVIIHGCLKNRNNCYSINLLKQIVGRDFKLNGGSFFLLLRQMQDLRQMQGIYNDVDVIKSLIEKIISCNAINQMQDINVDVMISSLIQKSISIDRRSSTE